MRKDVITMAHGSGGLDTAELMQDVFSKHFRNDILARLEDSAVLDLIDDPAGRKKEPSPCVPERTTETSSGVPWHTTEPSSCVSELTTEQSSSVSDASSRMAISTDTFVVTPLAFPGGDIGKLAVCGTVNDVLMSGAEPRYLTCGFIMETGLPISMLDEICASLAAAAKEADVTIVAGDTKVVEGRSEQNAMLSQGMAGDMTKQGGKNIGEGGGLMINTTGIGIFPSIQPSSAYTPITQPTPSGILPGDAIIVSGNLGDHHAAILSARMGIRNSIESDCALLTPIIHALRDAGVSVHSMRDVTRGGLGTVLNELAAASGVSIMLEEASIPVSPAVQAFCGMMGLDPLYMGNEGKLVLAVSPGEAERALAAIRSTGIGKNSALIGTASAAENPSEPPSGVTAKPPTGISEDLPPGVSNKTHACIFVPVTMRTRIGGTVRVDVLYGEGLPRIC